MIGLFVLVLPHMQLKPNCGSDRAWVWSTPADLSDEDAKPELLAIRFANSESKFIEFDDIKLLYYHLLNSVHLQTLWMKKKNVRHTIKDLKGGYS